MTTTQRSIAIYSVAAGLLTIPFFGMQVSKEVNWTLSDFMIGGVLLFGTAFLIDVILRKTKTNGAKIAYVALALLILFLIWAELAVGIFGSPFAGS